MNVETVGDGEQTPLPEFRAYISIGGFLEFWKLPFEIVF